MSGPRTSFASITQSNAADWALIMAEHAELVRTLPDRVLAHLRLLEGDFGGFPVDRLTHSLQTADRAARAGKDEEYVVCALLHDIGDTLAPTNHAELAAVILRPYISVENAWMLEQHALFQGYHFFHHLGADRDARERHLGHPCYDRTVEFCQEFDAAAFDASYHTPPLEEFVPSLVAVLSRPPRALMSEALVS